MFSLASCSPSNLYISLPDSFRISQEHAKQLEQKLNASEIARKEAEAKAQAANVLRTKLEAAENALKEAQDKAEAMKDKIDQIDAREAGLIKRFDAQSEKFGGNILCRRIAWSRHLFLFDLL
jgi:septal ring factor EnvC (AmiA/AmiB activator)